MPCRLDSLPDEILIHIQSFLPFRDASKACVLSHRWRFLSLYLMDLDLQPSEKHLSMIYHSGMSEVTASSAGYAYSVDRVICSVCNWLPPNDNALTRFRICYYLDESFSEKVESWLRFSFEKGVEVLELDCCYDGYTMPLCRFPSSIKSGLFPKLRLLKSLSLSSLAIDNDSLMSLFLSCEFLERLRLCNLWSLTEVNITGDVSRLKYIEMLGCSYMIFISILAPTPDLLSLRCHTFTHNFHVEHAPLLTDLVIGGSGSFFNILNHPLWRFTSQLESLHLDIDCQYDSCLELRLKLRDLQHLKISLLCLQETGQSLLQKNLHSLITLIKAATNIRRLTLEAWLPIYEKLKIGEAFNNLDLKFLRVIEYVGFRGRVVDHELVMRLANVTSCPIEKVIIDCRPETIRMGYEDYQFATTKIKEWKTRALKLKKRIRTGVELEFLD